MSLNNLWGQEDIERVLNAIEETATQFPISQFRTGWLRCIAAVRAGFGIHRSLWSEEDGKNAAEEGVPLRALDSPNNL